MPLAQYKAQVKTANAPQGASQAAVRAGDAAINTIRQFTQTVGTVGNAAIKSSNLAKEAENKDAIKRGEQAGFEATAAGDAQFKEGDDLETQTFNAVIRKGYQAGAENDLGSQLEELKAQFGNDAVGYEAAANGAIDGVLANIDDPETAANVRIYGDRKRADNALTIMKSARKNSEQEAAAEITTNINSKMVDTLNALRVGNFDQAEQMQLDVFANIDDAVDADYLTSAEGAKFKQTFGYRSIEQAAEGDFERLLEEDPDAANDYIKRIRKSGLQGVPPERWSSLADSMESDYKSVLREDAAARKEVAAQQALADDKTNQTVAVATAISTGQPLDYKNKDDKKSVDFIYSQTFDATDLADPAVQTAQIEFARQVGVVPSEMKSKIRTGLYSSNPDVIQAAADMTDRLIADFPQAVEQFSKQDIAYAQRIASLTEGGVPVDEAVTIHQQYLKQPVQDRRDAIMQNYKKDELNDLATDAVADWVDDKFDTFFTASPEVDPAMNQDYKRLFSEFVGLTGDVEQANKLAIKYMGNVWGVSNISGDPVMTKYPPEKILAKTDSDVDWITNDWNSTQDALRKEYGGVSISEGEKLLKANEKAVKAAREAATISGVKGSESAEVSTLMASGDDIRAMIEKSKGVKFELQADETTQRGNPPTWRVFITQEGGFPIPALNDDGSQYRWTANYMDTPEYKEQQLLEEAKVQRAKEMDRLQKELIASGSIGRFTQELNK